MYQNNYRISLRILVFLISSLASHVAFPQNDFRKGYIVTNNYDTVYGIIDYTTPGLSSQHCYFKKDSSDKIINYLPEDIKGYTIEGQKKFVTKSVVIWDTAKLQFLEYIVDGTYDLYSYWNLKEVYYFIEKDNKIYPLTNNEVIYYSDNEWPHARNSGKYKGILNYLIGDVGKWSNKIETTEFNQVALSNLIKDYNNEVCKDKNCIVYSKKESKKNDSKFQINVGLKTGVSVSALDFNFNIKSLIYQDSKGNNYPTYRITSTNLNSANSVIFSPGIFVNINRNGRISFQAELNYQDVNYSGIKFKALQIPIFLTYDFIHNRKFIPYINAGTFFDFLLSTAFENSYYLNYDVLLSEYKDPQTFSPKYGHIQYIFKESDVYAKGNFGFVAGAGVKMYIKRSVINFQFNLMHKRSIKYIDAFDEKITKTNYSVSLGYSYRIM